MPAAIHGHERRMATRRVRRTVRRSGNGVNVVADVNAVIATGDGAASASSVTTVTQTGGTKTQRKVERDA